MARTDSLTNWMTDIANSIREKTEKSDLIPASEFDLEIRNIKTSDTTIEDEYISGEWSLENYSNDRIDKIGSYAFFENDVLQSIYAPFVTTIESRAFYSANALASINCPLLTTIGEAAFGDCGKLKSVNFPLVTDETFGEGVFMNAVGVEEAVIPNITIIPNNCFYNCYRLQSFDLSNITKVGESGFYKCALTSINAPNLTYISRYGFSSCKNLTNVILESVTHVGENAFQYCSGLESIDFHCLSNILFGAFVNATALNKLIIRTNKVVSFGSGMLSGTPIKSGTGYIYVPDNLVESYKSATNWSEFGDQIRGLSDLEVSING